MVDFQERDTTRGISEDDEEREEDAGKSGAESNADTKGDASTEQEGDAHTEPEESPDDEPAEEGDEPDFEQFYSEPVDPDERDAEAEQPPDSVADEAVETDADTDGDGEAGEADPLAGLSEDIDDDTGGVADHQEDDTHDPSHESGHDAESGRADHSHDAESEHAEHSHAHADHSHHAEHHHAHDLETLDAAVVTVSSSRSLADDPSGDTIVQSLVDHGHQVVTRELIADDFDGIQHTVDTLANRRDVDIVVTTGGTGVTPDDQTIEAIRPLFDKELPGFGELFRTLSFDEIGSRIVATRATAGIVEEVPVFCLPGSENAVRLGAEEIIAEQAPHLAGLAGRDDDHGHHHDHGDDHDGHHHGDRDHDDHEHDSPHQDDRGHEGHKHGDDGHSHGDDGHSHGDDSHGDDEH